MALPVDVGGVKYDPLNLGSLLAQVRDSSAATHDGVMKQMKGLSKLLGKIEEQNKHVAATMPGGMSRHSPVVSSGGQTSFAEYHGPRKVNQWATTALRIMGLPVDKFKPGLINMIMHESGGNPNATNNWDSNAAAGTPSMGLMQTIQPTFEAYDLPGHHQILNPVDNILAGLNYAIHRYGKHMVKEGGRHDASGNYIGY